VPQLTDLWQHGQAWSVDLLGEATISDREADRYRDHCMESLTLLAREAMLWPSFPLLERDHLGPIPRVQLSLKISALSPHLDPIIRKGATGRWHRGFDPSSIWPCAFRLLDF